MRVAFDESPDEEKKTQLRITRQKSIDIKHQQWHARKFEFIKVQRNEN
jgi:hypothetical protein